MSRSTTSRASPACDRDVTRTRDRFGGVDGDFERVEERVLATDHALLTAA